MNIRFEPQSDSAFDGIGYQSNWLYYIENAPDFPAKNGFWMIKNTNSTNQTKSQAAFFVQEYENTGSAKSIR